MARTKIDYGIDLGTTNSAICRMEKGIPKMKRSDIQKDIMPSCVSVNRKGALRVGDGAYNTMKQDKRRATKSWRKEASNTYIEFKRTMATDKKYECGNLGKSFTSEELSAEVLKTLKSFVTDENVSCAIITVPAKFSVNQKTATLEAAKMAGFEKVELLQEPIAASMAYGLTADEKDGIWMVFDFGGGTFDAALVKVEDGIMQVFDTEGDNYLGGKNLDYAIVDEIIIPYLRDNYSVDGYLQDPVKKDVLRDAMKTYAEDVKNQLSFKEKEDIISNLGDLGEDEDGEEIELDLTVTQAQLYGVIRPYFQKAVDICRELISRNKLKQSQISKLILVGGPTHSPLIRQMLKEQVTPNVDTSIDPMTAVATGAALYASTIDAVVSDSEIEVGTVKLNLGYASTSVETTEFVSVKLEGGTSLPKVDVELVRADKSWSSGKYSIDEVGDVIDVELRDGRANSFNVMCYDSTGNPLPCFPSEITIIQGSSVGAAPLAYNIGISIWSDVRKCGVFRMAKGLEKNKPLPALGVINDLKTPAKLRPGVSTDIITIPVYGVDGVAEEAEGRPTTLYEHISDVVITGDEVGTLIPEDSLVDVTLKADSSEQMTLEVHFLASDITIYKALDTSKKHETSQTLKEIQTGLANAQAGIARLAESGIDTRVMREELARLRQDAQNPSEPKEVLKHLRDLLIDIVKVEDGTEWQRVEKELREEFDDLERAQNDLGNEETARNVAQLRMQTDEAIRAKDPKLGRTVLDQVRELFVHLTLVYQCAGLIQNCNSRFGSMRWKDASRARQLVNRGMEEINNGPTVDKLHPIAVELIRLMPDDEAANAGGLLK